MARRSNTILVALGSALLLTGCVQGPLLGGESGDTGPPDSYAERIQYDRATDDRAPPGIGGSPGPAAHGGAARGPGGMGGGGAGGGGTGGAR